MTALIGSAWLKHPTLEIGGGLSPPRTPWAGSGMWGSPGGIDAGCAQKKGSRCQHSSETYRDLLPFLFSSELDSCNC